MRDARITALILLLSFAALAGGIVEGNPTNLRPTRKIPTTGLANGHRAIAAWRDLSAGYKPWGAGVEDRPRPGRAAHLSGPVVGLRAVGLDGTIIEIPVLASLDLSGPLPVPDQPMADLEIVVGGRVTVWLDVSHAGQIVGSLEIDRLTVAIDDPEAAAQAGLVVIDLDLDGAQIDPDSLQDSLLAVSP